MSARKFLSIAVAATIILFHPGLALSRSKKKSRDKIKSKYWMPFPGGMSRHINQGFHGRWTHNDGNQNEYAIDFGGVVGDIICAARAGTVISVTDADDTDDKNVIMIQHEDDEVSVYAHNNRGTTKVEEGDDVVAGQQICRMGKLLHLHFAVWLEYRGIPMGFKDVDEPNGEPKEFKVYKSKNYLNKRAHGIIDPEELAKASLAKLMSSARNYMKKKKYSYARKYYDRALEHEEANDKVRKEIEKAYAEIETEAKKQYEKAKKLLAEGKAAKAKKALYRIMRYFKGTSVFEDARKLLRSFKAGSIEAQQVIQSPEKLLELVDELVKEERFNAVFDLLNTLGKLKTDIGEKARKIRKDLMNSKEFMKKRDNAKAEEELRLIFERVENLIRYDQFDEAINQLKRIIRDYPDSPWTEKAREKIEEIEEMR